MVLVIQRPKEFLIWPASLESGVSKDLVFRLVTEEERGEGDQLDVGGSHLIGLMDVSKLCYSCLRLLQLLQVFHVLKITQIKF